MLSGINRSGRQQGVALAYLLWMLAALTLMAGGVMTVATSDIRATARQLNEARTRAAGIGGAHLLLRSMEEERSEGNYDGRSLYQRSFIVGELEVAGTAIPVSGLVSLNRAPVQLLAALFQHAADLGASDAQSLADAVVLWREDAIARAPRGAVAFRVPEDLLRVPGITRSVYDRVRRLIHAETAQSDELAAGAAPPGNLLVLAAGDAEQVARELAAREDDGQSERESSGGPDGEFGGGVYCVEVDVLFGDGQVLQQRVWVSLSSGAGAGALPWRMLRTEPVEAVRVDTGDAS